MSSSVNQSLAIAAPKASSLSRSLGSDLGMALAGSLVVAACAQIVVPMQPVAWTGQTLGVLLVGAVLGPRLGVMAMLAYLAQGAAGLPVFAGGVGGLGFLIGKTGGYLLGFVGAAFITGWLVHRGWGRRFPTRLAAMLLASLFVFVPGVIVLSLFVGPALAFKTGFIGFIPEAIAKSVLAAALMPMGWKAMAWLSGSRPLR